MPLVQTLLAALTVRATLGGKATVRPAPTSMNAASQLSVTHSTTATSMLAVSTPKAPLNADATRDGLAMDSHAPMSMNAPTMTTMNAMSMPAALTTMVPTHAIATWDTPATESIAALAAQTSTNAKSKMSDRHLRCFATPTPLAATPMDLTPAAATVVTQATASLTELDVPTSTSALTIPTTAIPTLLVPIQTAASLAPATSAGKEMETSVPILTSAVFLLFVTLFTIATSTPVASTPMVPSLAAAMLVGLVTV